MSRCCPDRPPKAAGILHLPPKQYSIQKTPPPPSYQLLCLSNPLLGTLRFLPSPSNHFVLTTPNRYPSSRVRTLRPARTDASSELNPGFRDENLLQKYDMLPDAAVLAGEKHMPLYDDLITNYSATVIAGGGTNIARGAQYILPADHVLFMGCIGRDTYGERLTAECEKAGVATAFRVDDTLPTGRCGVIITGHHRSLCTNLGAANEYSVDHLRRPEVWRLVENAEVYYIEGYHLTVCVDAAVALGEEAARVNKTFLFNFSAAFVPRDFGEAVANVLPYADCVIGNETEALAWAASMAHTTTSIPEIARLLAGLPKKNTKRTRTVIITQGRSPTISVAAKGDGFLEVNEHPVRVVLGEKIQDTNGAG